MICQHFVPGPPREILQGGTILLWGPRTDWNLSQNCGFELKIPPKIIMKKSKEIHVPFLGSPSPVPMYRLTPPYRPCVPLTSPADELKLQSLKIDGCGPSSVIKIVKMKYNRIVIKMWLVSTSFKINIEILFNLYITYTISNYNTISLRCSFFLFQLKVFIKQHHTVYM
jgi:hypothetical protein